MKKRFFFYCKFDALPDSWAVQLAMQKNQFLKMHR